MEIDWITLTAQILNFAILVALLRRFLYGRIVETIEGRQAGIRSRLDEADRKQVEAEEEAEEARRERRQQEERREEVFRDAREEAEEERRRLEKEAREEIQRERERWRRGLRREREEFLHDVRERASAATYEALRRALQDLAEEDLQRQVVTVFSRRLVDAEDRAELEEAVAGADELIVRSAFELEQGERDELGRLLADELGAAVEPRFETSPELVLGLRLEAGGHEVEWSASDYLSLLEKRVSELLEEQDPEELDETDDDGGDPGGSVSRKDEHARTGP